MVGSGIAGLAAARGLSGGAAVTLYEAGSWFGGHSRTVGVTRGGEIPVGVFRGRAMEGDRPNSHS